MTIQMKLRALTAAVMAAILVIPSAALAAPQTTPLGAPNDISWTCVVGHNPPEIVVLGVLATNTRTNMDTAAGFCDYLVSTGKWLVGDNKVQWESVPGIVPVCLVTMSRDFNVVLLSAVDPNSSHLAGSYCNALDDGQDRTHWF
jgi:hypothetical protein